MKLIFQTYFVGNVREKSLRFKSLCESRGIVTPFAYWRSMRLEIHFDGIAVECNSCINENHISLSQVDETQNKIEFLPLFHPNCYRLKDFHIFCRATQIFKTQFPVTGLHLRIVSSHTMHQFFGSPLHYLSKRRSWMIPCRIDSISVNSMLQNCETVSIILGLSKSLNAPSCLSIYVDSYHQRVLHSFFS